MEADLMPPKYMMGFSQEKIKPYQDIDNARMAIANSSQCEGFLVEYDDNLNITEGRIRTALVIYKSLRTIETQFNEFRRYYNVEYVTKLFWNKNKWQVSYNPSQCLYSIKSGSHLTYDSSTVKNRNEHVSSILLCSFYQMIHEIRGKWPIVRFDEFIKQLEKIATAERYNN